jgi:hypothetical protein
MLHSDAWRRAEQILHTAGYICLATQFRGTDANGSSSRLRVYIVVMSTRAYTQDRCERIMAPLNEKMRISQLKSVHHVLPDARSTFYWDPHNDTAPSVLSTKIPMPSPVSRKPGRAPSSNYKWRGRDAGAVEEAMVLSVQQVATLLGFQREIPSAPATTQKRWVAGLIQPNCVSMLMQCVHAVAPLNTDWLPPPRRNGRHFRKGTTIVHDTNAPPPEWLVQNESNDMKPRY